MPKIDLNICKGCGICIDACLNNSITIEKNKATFNKNKCIGCEVCISSCPNGAIISDRRRTQYAYPRPIPKRSMYYYPNFNRNYYPYYHRRMMKWY